MQNNGTQIDAFENDIIRTLRIYESGTQTNVKAIMWG